MDETHEAFVGDDALFEKRAAEMQKKMTRRDGSTMTLAQSKRASELQRDITAWEENRLFRSGVVSLREARPRPAALQRHALSVAHQSSPDKLRHA